MLLSIRSIKSTKSIDSTKSIKSKTFLPSILPSVILSMVGACFSVGVSALNWTSDVEMATEVTLFPEDGAYGQKSSNISFSVMSEWYSEWNDGQDSFVFTPFVRIDQQDNERTHVDIRELAWTHVADSYELSVGIRKVFWGVTESQNIVDVINQNDSVEGVSEVVKLGQPMVNISIERDWGVLDVFWLVGFREQTFAGEGGRWRFPFVMDTDRPLYESSAKEKRGDFAVRWQYAFGEWEVAISHFSGTNRQASPVLNELGEAQPHYNVIDQTGIEVQTFYGDWIWKWESITRSGDVDINGATGRYSAAVAGFEYTRVGVFDTAMDLGWVAEFLFDDRDIRSAGIYEQDLMLGTRWTWNNTADTTALIGFIVDIETHESSMAFEAAHRLAEGLKLELNAGVFAGSAEPPTLAEFLNNEGPDLENKMASYGNDDYVKAEITYYF